MRTKKNVNFVSIVNDGTRPDAEIHCAGFDSKTGIEVCTQLTGGQRTMAHMVSAIVEHFLEQLKEHQGVEAAAAFVNILGESFASAGPEVMKMAVEIRAKAAMKRMKGMKDLIEKMEEAGLDLGDPDGLDLDDLDLEELLEVLE